MCKSVVILLPHRGAHDEVQRRYLLPPPQLIADLQPFGVLGSHGVDDPGKGLVGCKEAVPSCQQISFKPAFAHMFAEHGIHHPAVHGEMIVRIVVLGIPVPVLHLKHAVQAV